MKYFWVRKLLINNNFDFFETELMGPVKNSIEPKTRCIFESGAGNDHRSALPSYDK